MPRGKVKWFSIEKGYGFIRPDDGGTDVFIHRNNIEGLGWGEGLREGEDVEYELERTTKGLNAQNLHRLSDSY